MVTQKHPIFAIQAPQKLELTSYRTLNHRVQIHRFQIHRVQIHRVQIHWGGVLHPRGKTTLKTSMVSMFAYSALWSGATPHIGSKSNNEQRTSSIEQPNRCGIPFDVEYPHSYRHCRDVVRFIFLFFLLSFAQAPSMPAVKFQESVIRKGNNCEQLTRSFW